MGDYHPALSEMGVDQIDWWAGRWEAGQSGWHSAAPQPPLVTHLPTLSEGSEGGLRVLVPLCGKAGCLTHLHKAGHDVSPSRASTSPFSSGKSATFMNFAPLYLFLIASIL